MDLPASMFVDASWSCQTRFPPTTHTHTPHPHALKEAVRSDPSFFSLGSHLKCEAAAVGATNRGCDAQGAWCTGVQTAVCVCLGVYHCIPEAFAPLTTCCPIMPDSGLVGRFSCCCCCCLCYTVWLPALTLGTGNNNTHTHTPAHAHTHLHMRTHACTTCIPTYQPSVVAGGSASRRWGEMRPWQKLFFAALHVWCCSCATCCVSHRSTLADLQRVEVRAQIRAVYSGLKVRW